MSSEVSDLITALERVEQLARSTVDTLGSPDWPASHTVASWCRTRIERLHADRADNIEMGRQLYEMIVANPGDQDYFELGSLARHLTDKADRDAAARDILAEQQANAIDDPGA